MNTTSAYNLLVVILSILSIIGLVMLVIGMVNDHRRFKRYMQTWQCPNCKYIITGATKELAKDDYPCPRCKKRKISEFVKRSDK